MKLFFFVYPFKSFVVCLEFVPDSQSFSRQGQKQLLMNSFSWWIASTGRKRNFSPPERSWNSVETNVETWKHQFVSQTVCLVFKMMSLASSKFISIFLVSCNQHRSSLVKLAGIVVVVYFRWVKDLNKFVWKVAEIEISWRRPCRCHKNGNTTKVGNWVFWDGVWVGGLEVRVPKVYLWGFLSYFLLCCLCLSVLSAYPPPLLSLML